MQRWHPNSVALAAIFAFALLSPCATQADDRAKPKPYALIFGTVWDPDGHALYGIKVKVRRADEKKSRWEVYSNHSGEFAQRVPVGPGDYVVWTDVKGVKLADGRRLQAGPDVKVHIDADERSDIGLHLNW